jgi:predicted dithiol-disulfide oxidoreductase (DUF899 family)
MHDHRSHIAADQAYREQRMELLRREASLRDEIESVARLRRSLPRGPEVSYSLVTGPASINDADHEFDVALSDLFARDHDTLVVYHLMYGPDAPSGCPMCSSWIDGLNGVAPHLAEHVSFVVAAKASLPMLRSWARSRRWDRVRIVSTGGTSFNADLGVEDADGNQFPAMSVFERDTDGRVFHRYTQLAFMPGDTGRGIDQMGLYWNVFDLTPGGRPNWWPGNDYPTTYVVPGI